MKFEVVESISDWILRCDGVELARFSGQDEALADVAERLRKAVDVEPSYSLAVRYAARG
ncbi:hypothetical protein [Phenylobacterium sp.]|uniref:hypothetical protein n=1 Tax=Phenylobacterium sp. TaxID=1871053 RepID=UPI00374D56F8